MIETIIILMLIVSITPMAWFAGKLLWSIAKGREQFRIFSKELEKLKQKTTYEDKIPPSFWKAIKAREEL